MTGGVRHFFHTQYKVYRRSKGRVCAALLTGGLRWRSVKARIVSVLLPGSWLLLQPLVMVLALGLWLVTLWLLEVLLVLRITDGDILRCILLTRIGRSGESLRLRKRTRMKGSLVL